MSRLPGRLALASMLSWLSAACTHTKHHAAADAPEAPARDAPAPPQPHDASTLAAATLAREAALNAVEDVTDALTEGDAGPSIFAGVSAGIPTVVLNCSVQTPGVLAVAAVYSGSVTGSTVLGGGTTVQSTLVSGGTETRVWTAPAGQGVACQGPNTSVVVNWNDPAVVNGLILAVTTARSESRSLSVTASSGGSATPQRIATTIHGQRQVLWTLDVDTQDAWVRTKTLTYQITRSRAYGKTGEAPATLNAALAVDASAPLSVTTVRDKTTGELVSQTIRSGVVTSTLASGEVQTLSYNNVVYDLSAANASRCQPISGTVTVTNGAATTPVTLTFGGQETYPELSATDCELVRNF